MSSCSAQEKKACSFLKKRTKKLLFHIAFYCNGTRQHDKSFLLLFFSKKEVLSSQPGRPGRMVRMLLENDSQKNREIYDHADDPIWHKAVYEPLHDGWEFTNIGGSKILNLLADQARLGTGDQVLDVGCGTGASCQFLADRFGCSVTGLDINDSQIRRARRRIDQRKPGGVGALRFLRQDVSRWTPDRAYDAAYSLDSLTLIPGLRRVLAMCRAALRREGRLVLADLVAGPELTEAMRNFAYREDGVINLMPPGAHAVMVAEAGFADIEVADHTDDAVHAFTVIQRIVETLHPQPGMPEAKITEWRSVSQRYLDAFAGGQLGYARISASAA